MTPEAQRIAIAEACGWTSIERFQISQNDEAPWYVQGVAPDSWKGKDVRPWLPDFTSDLNAMAEAESSIPQPSDFYRYNLIEVCGSDQRIHLATAAQRAEAFLRTIGRWEDTP